MPGGRRKGKSGGWRNLSGMTMRIENFKRGDRVLIKCGVGLTMADVRSVIRSSGQLMIKPMYEEPYRIVPSRVLRRYDREGNLLEVAPPPEQRKRRGEDAWLENLRT